MTEVQTASVEASGKQAQPAGRLRAHLIRGAAGSFVLQVGFAGLAFLNAIILARILGAEGYGAFVNAMAWVSLLTIPATFGFGILLVRDTAIYRSQEKWGQLKGLLRFSNRIVFVLSVVLALIAAAVAGWLFSSPTQATMRHTVWIALVLLPLFSLYNLREAATRGLECVIRACLPGMIVRPGLLFVGIVSIYYFWPKHLSAPTAMVVNVGAGLVALALGMFFLRTLLPQEVKTATPEYTLRPWLKAALPMLIYGGAQVILGQTDIVMLGAMRGAHEVGLYAAANRLAFLITYALLASNMILAPVISRLYNNGEKDRLQNIITKNVRVAFLLVVPFSLMLVFKGDYILSYFGREFMLAQSALVILTISYLIAVSLGAGAPILSMTGYPQKVAVVLSLMVFLNISLNVILIPSFGINGASVATAASSVGSGLLLALLSKKNSGITPTIFGNVIARIKISTKDE